MKLDFSLDLVTAFNFASMWYVRQYVLSHQGFG